MRDEVARLSETVARDPAGMAWVALADALRRARQLQAAARVAERGLGRHPYSADGHDVLARIAADGGALERARDEWEMAVRLEARHVGALLGLSWLALSSGDAPGARRWWEAARQAAPADPRVAAAGQALAREPVEPAAAAATAALADAAPPDRAAEPPAPAASASGGRDAPPTFESSSRLAPSARLAPDLLPPGAMIALAVDADGLVVAGGARGSSGSSSTLDGGAGGAWTDALAAELTGLTREAQLALTGLQLGAWERLQVECEALQLALAPMADGGVTLVATDASAPAGLSRLLLERTRRRAQAWVEAL